MARNGNARIVEALLKARADIDARNTGGLSALMMAAANNYFEAREERNRDRRDRA